MKPTTAAAVELSSKDVGMPQKGGRAAGDMAKSVKRRTAMGSD
jgi:hypothetical protein